MDMGTMNDTRKKITQLNQQRGTKDNPILGKSDGKTKDRVEGWRKNISNLTSDLKAQVNILEELDSGVQTTDGGGEMQRNYFEMIVGKLMKDIEEYVRICQKVTTLNIKKSVTSKELNDQNWTLMRTNMRNQAMQVLVQGQDPSVDKFMLLAKMMNMRENLQKQVFHSSLYRKLIIWTDLNIQPDEWCHQKVVECINQINDFQENLKYKPTMLQFEEVSLDLPGYFSFSDQGGASCESTETLDAMIQSFVDMENLIKKNFMMQSEKLSKFAETNPVQMTLREEVEFINQENSDLQSKLKKQLELYYSKNKDNDSKDLQDEQVKFDQMKHKLSIAEMTVIDKEKNLKNLESHQVQLKSQIRNAEDKINRYENWYHPRLKETIKFQKELKEALEKIKQDAELLPEMFRAEARYRKENKKEKDEAIEKMTSAMKQHNKLVAERDDLKSELERKKRLAQQAMAARSEIKNFLDQAKNQVATRDNEIQDFKLSMDQASKEVDRFKHKHDEMFASVSGLNNRIEELEQHKLHLLEKLKSYGDRGDLSYIVKTQKLDNIKAKDMKDRVVLEEYNPEKGRKEKDEQYERLQKDKSNDEQQV